MRNGPEGRRRQWVWTRKRPLTQENQSLSASGIRFPFVDIRDEFNQWKGFTMKVTSDVLSAGVAQETAEIFNVSYPIRLLTDMVATRVRKNDSVATWEGIEVEFYDEKQPQPFMYMMTFEPRHLSFSIDSNFYQLSDLLGDQ